MDQISRLTEMGFTVEKAQEALRLTNNDVSKAIDYLFGEPIEIEKPVDTVNITNTEDVPDFTQMTEADNGESFEELDYRQVNDNDDDEDSDDDVVADDGASLILVGEDNIDNLPTTVILNKLHNYDIYLVPILVILSQSSQFRQALLEKDVDNEFFKELQYLTYFLTHDSPKFYTTLDRLIDLIPEVFKSDLSNRSLSIEEVLLKIYEDLSGYYQEVYGLTRLEELLQSHVESIIDDVKSGLYILEIELDNRNMNLYTTLNELFWQSNFKNLGLIKYNRLSPILTVHLVKDDGDDDMLEEINPFQLLEEFVPDLYTDKCLQKIIELRNKEVELQQQRNSVTTDLLNLNFFEGKKVSQLLVKLIERLEDGEAKEDLKQLQQSIGTLVTEYNQKQDQYREQMRLNDVRNYENILNYIKTSDAAVYESLVVYKLIGVIFKPNTFIHRRRGKWYYVNNVYSHGRLRDVEVEEFSFSDVQGYVENYTRLSSNELTMIYGVDGHEVEFGEDIVNRFKQETTGSSQEPEHKSAPNSQPEPELESGSGSESESEPLIDLKDASEAL